jgi:class 3 adenylate cyclase
VAAREFQYEWKFNLKSAPNALWPFVADTDRFNRDTGLPALLPHESVTKRLFSGRRRLAVRKAGVTIVWEEEPFEWVRPYRFGVRRRYISGPVSEMQVIAEFQSAAGGGTLLIYRVNIRPANALGSLLIPVQIGRLAARRFAKVLARYDRLAIKTRPSLYQSVDAELALGDAERLQKLASRLTEEGANQNVVDLMEKMIREADDLFLARIRPYELADHWNVSRREVLETALMATRAGMLDLQWDIICPHCRGAGETASTLAELTSSAYCAGCNIDFSVDFDRSVELTFRPNGSIRKVEADRFCIGGPEITPHIIAQQLLKPSEVRSLEVPLEEGRYRMRTRKMPSAAWLKATPDGRRDVELAAWEMGWPESEAEISTLPTFTLSNQTNEDQLFILERTSWSDQAATAAEVTALQTFRDLFSTEALRRGEQISVGSLTVVFTDLRGSTQLYRQIGDAPAFGRVMNHFDILREAIKEEDGALVKTIGDAVMAVFRRPANALRAILRAQRELAAEREGRVALILKAGIHSGPCIAVTLNDRLDYFGGTINMASRLEGLSTGHDIILSDAVMDDPEVNEILKATEKYSATAFRMNLKGFDTIEFDLWRVAESTPHTAVRIG